MEFQVYDSWRSLSPAQAADVERLLTVSFPPEERRSLEEIRRNLDGPWLELLSAEENGRIYGMVTVWNLEDFTFLEHFAVDPDYRNKGIGSQVLEFVAEFWDKPTVLEVEHPTGPMERRRIGFYQRNGYVLNDYPYLMPDLSGGDQPVPLLLMSRPAPLADPEDTARQIYAIPYREKKCPI